MPRSRSVPAPRRTRRGLRLLAAAVVPLALLVASCGGDSTRRVAAAGRRRRPVRWTPSTPADGPVEITVWNNYTALPKRTFEAMVGRVQRRARTR